MTRSGDQYVRGLRDGRAVLLNGERVGDVTTHPAFAAGIRTVAQLYDLAHDPGQLGIFLVELTLDLGQDLLFFVV